ncbi:MAG: HD domain-containing protein, partial [Nitrosopumilaceae archaeon]
TPYTAHLESVVSYLKSLGITDEDVLCSGWLHDTIEDTDTTFDDLYERFGKKVAILVSSLSKDEKLPKKDRERLYVKQLKDASLEAKIIKLWDISANLKDLAISGMSKSKRKKTANQKLHYLKVIKNDIIENKSNYPKISNLIKGINYVLVKNGQKSVLI